jgi:hypothetical protein
MARATRCGWPDGKIEAPHLRAGAGPLLCHVTGTPAELILDFGLTHRDGAGGCQAGQADAHRLVTNLYSAKRLLGVLHVAIQEHESV